MAKRTAQQAGPRKKAVPPSYDLTTREGAEALRAAMAASRAEMDHSPEAARARLLKMGIITPSGRLSRRYATPKA